MHKLVQILHTIWRGEQSAYPGLLAVLKPLALLYAAWMRLRAYVYRRRLRTVHKLPCCVISVGNLSVGGTGKTPMVLYLADRLTSAGYAVVVISRGYRGRFEASGGVVSDGRNILVGARASGDEPQILAKRLRGVPVIVGANRYLAGQRAIRQFNPDVLLLDDAFQHLKLHRDLDIVLLDCTRPFGNGDTLPAGELREPVRALNRSHAVVLTRCPADGAGMPAGAGGPLVESLPGPVFQSRHQPVIRDIIAVQGTPRTEYTLSGRRVFAFSGLAKNEDFLYTLSGFGCEVVGSQGFPDHHFFSERDLAFICRQARDLTVDCIVTTEKDHVKIEPAMRWPVDLAVVGVDISFGDDEARFGTWLGEQLPGRTI